MSYIRYEIDPNDPEKTQSNRAKAYGLTFVGMIIFFANLFCIAFFISSTIKLFNETYYSDYVISSLWLLGMFLLDTLPFAFISDKKKSFLINVFLCLFIICGLLVMILGIAQLCNSISLGALMICLSIFLFLTYVFLKVLDYRKSNNMNLHFFKNRNERANTDIYEVKKQVPISNTQFIFCYKCGNKIPIDSSFCSFCGVSLPKDNLNG